MQSKEVTNFVDTLSQMVDSGYFTVIYNRAFGRAVRETRGLTEEERVKECKLTGGTGKKATVMDKMFNNLLDNKQLRKQYKII